MSRIVAALIGLLLWVQSACVQAQGTCPVAGGAPRAQACTDEPASLPAEGPDRGAGNPIDVTTGNKYERVADHAHPLDPASDERIRRVRAAIAVHGNPWWAGDVLGDVVGDALDLSMVRHYNSRNGYSLSLGPGWSHGYDTRLARLPRSAPRGRGALPAAALQILQADGRRIRFLPLRRVDRHTVRYRAIDIGDGTIDERDDPTASAPAWAWRWPGGRELAFDSRGRLISIRSGNGDRLDLRHDGAGRLAAVADDRGRTLGFEYYPASLPPAKGEPAGYGGRLAAVVLVSGKRIVYRYDRFGSLAEVLHPSGAWTRYRYDSASSFGHLTGIESSDGRRARFAYDEQGRAVLSQAAPYVEPIELAHRLPRDRRAEGETTVSQGNRRSTYRWRMRTDDGSPMLLAAEGRPCDGCPRTGVIYGYDVRQRLTSVAGTDPTHPGRLLVRRDSSGRIIGIDEATTARVTLLRRYRYDAGDETARLRSIERPSVAPRHTNTVTIDRDAAGRPVALVEHGWLPVVPEDAARPTPVAAHGPRTGRPLERRVSFTYATEGSPDAGHLKSITDPLGNVHEFGHHQRRLSEFTYPIPALRERFEHDAIGRLARRMPIDGVAESYGYDDADRLVRIERAGRQWTVRHAPGGLIEAFEDNAGRRWRVEHDEHGRPRRLVDGGNASIAIDRDDNGHTVVTHWRDAIGDLERQETLGFDDQGRVNLTRSGTSAPTRTIHDPSGVIVERTDPVGIVTRWSFDPATSEIGRLVAVGSTVEALLAQRSTPDGHRIVDPAGRTWRQWRDDFERIVLTDEPDLGITVFRHDAAGRLIGRITREGRAIEYRHDSIGRLVAIVGEAEYRYEGTRLVERRERDQHESFRHDAAGRVIERTVGIDGHRWSEGFGYDALGRLVERRLVDGNRLTYDHDPLTGRLSSIGFNGRSLISGIGTTISGIPLRWVHGNGARTSIAMSAEGRIRQVRHGGDHFGIEEAVTRDDAGRIIAIERQGPNPLSSTRRMTYDPLGRLVAVGVPAGGVDRWRYDAGGERLDATPAAAGRRQRFEFDADRRLVVLRDADGQVVASYRYNSRGERIAKSGAGYYLYADQRLAAETDGSGAVVGMHVYLGERPVAWLLTDPRCVRARDEDQRRIAGGGFAALQVRWQRLLRGEADATECTIAHAVHTDHLGTPIALSDPSGALVWRAEHDTWGNTTRLHSRTPIPYNIRFPGQYFDAESGLHYNYHRYYDPQQGRYLTPDPIGLAGGLYSHAYADLDPVGKSDPLGLATFSCIKPLHAFGGEGDRSGPDIPGNPFYHQFLCVRGASGGVICNGLDRTGSGIFPGSSGVPSNDQWPRPGEGTCELVDSRQCMDHCVAMRIMNPRRPWYAVAPWGTDCQEWVDDVLSSCRGNCRGRE